MGEENRALFFFLLLKIYESTFFCNLQKKQKESHFSFCLSISQKKKKNMSSIFNPPLTCLADNSVAPTPYQNEQLILSRSGVKIILNNVETASKK